MFSAYRSTAEALLRFELWPSEVPLSIYVKSKRELEKH